MKEFFLTSTIPYWVVFALVATACVMELLNLRKGAVSKQSVLMVTVLALGGTILELLIYTLVGGNVLWWCTADELGFFARLLRVIPLFLTIATVVVVAGGVLYLFSSGISKEFAKSSPSRPVFYDDDCHAHYSTGSLDNANRQ